MKLHTLLLLCLAAVLYAAADKHVVAPPPVAVNDTPAVKVEPLAPVFPGLHP